MVSDCDDDPNCSSQDNVIQHMSVPLVQQLIQHSVSGEIVQLLECEVVVDDDVEPEMKLLNVGNS